MTAQAQAIKERIENYKKYTKQNKEVACPHYVKIKEKYAGNFQLFQKEKSDNCYFIGYFVNNDDGRFYFEKNQNMSPSYMIILPHSWIEYMYPINNFYDKEDIGIVN